MPAEIVAWYKSEQKEQRGNEFLEGDYLQEVTAAAHKVGMRVLARMDVSKSFPELLEAHPDWFRRDPDGRVPRHWDMLTTCPTGPFWHDYNYRVVEELLRRYAIDGLFYNAYNYLRCYCERCRLQFRNEKGYELPHQEDWNDPAWRAYVQYRYEQHAEYTRKLAAFIDECSPGAVLTVDTNITTDRYKGIRESGWSVPDLARVTGCITSEAFNFTDRPHPKWLYWAGEEVKIGRHFQQTCIILNYSKSIWSRRSAQPAAQIAYDLMQVAAAGGSPAVAFSGTFQQHDRTSMDAVRETMRFLARHEREYKGMQPVAEAGLVYSQRTADFYGQEEPAERWQSHYRGMYEMLAECHIPFTVLHEGALTEEHLRPLKWLLLPNIALLNDEEAEVIDRFVREGGSLILTYETGLYEEDGRRISNGANRLDCVQRIVRTDKPTTGTYLYIKDRARYSRLGPTDLFMLEDGFHKTSPMPGASNRTTDLYRVPPVRNTTPEYAYWEQVTDDPGLIRTNYGKGTVFDLPWCIDKLYHKFGIPEYRDLIESLLDEQGEGRLLTTNAPACAEISITSRRKKGATSCMCCILPVTTGSCLLTRSPCIIYGFG